MSKSKSPLDDLSRSELIKLVRMQAAAMERLEKRVEELEAKLNETNPTERLDQSYSLNAEDKRKEEEKKAKGDKGRKRPKPLRRGRITTADKIERAERTEAIYPENVRRSDCTLSHTRVAWRLENGKATLVAYEIYRYRNEFGKIEGVLGRSEFGIEIVLATAYQVYSLGLSIDKACQVLSFFQQLDLKKSQADRLLNQLASAGKPSSSLCA